MNLPNIERLVEAEAWNTLTTLAKDQRHAIVVMLVALKNARPKIEKGAAAQKMLPLGLTTLSDLLAQIDAAIAVAEAIETA